MENLEIILSCAGTALGLLITAVTFILKFINSAKAKKLAENVNKIGKAALTFIEDAEKFINYSGAEKKEYVLTKANQYAIANGIDFDATLVSARIEELVALTKSVNARDKDKAATTAA